jgi:hypothetical protein
MTMRAAARSITTAVRGRRNTGLRATAAGLAGVAAALIVSCGSSGKGLIPASAAGPLKSDFEAVEQAAENANGDCTVTEAALRKTEEDFSALPGSVDAGLRSNLHQGIANLRVRAHEMCVQPSAQTTTTAPASTTTAPTTTTDTAPTTTTQTTPSTTAPTTSSPGGGTAAPGEEETEAGKGKANGHGGTGAGEGGPGGVGAGEPEGGK